MRNDNQSSEIHIKVQNIENSTIKKITITTQKDKSKSTVILNIISVKKRTDLPDGIFDMNE